MNEKTNKIYAYIFIIFISLMFILSLVLPKKLFSENENRYLQKTPKVNAETIGNGKAMAEIEAYTSDHVVLRDTWVFIHALSMKAAGKAENGDVFYADDMLIAKLGMNDTDKAYSNMKYVNKLANSVQCPVSFCIIPSAAGVYSEKLPYGAPAVDEYKLIDELYSSAEAEIIDLRDVMDSHKDEYIFYKTDHHWTSLGAYYAAAKISNALGTEIPDINTLEKKTVSEDFYGTNWSKAGSYWVDPDEIDTYVSEDGLEIESYFTAKPEEGHLYHEEYLDKKDKYSYFLGGNQALTVIKTGNEGPKVLLIRDSYSSSIAPFMTFGFSEVHMIDLRYNRNSVTDYIEENDIDEVIILYGLQTFVQDTNLAVLGR